MPLTTVELTIRRLPDASLVAELRAELPHSRADLGSAPVQISAEALHGLELLPDAYGAALTAMALPAPLHPAWAKARGYAAGAGSGLRVRVAIDDPAGALHALRWELLRDPLTNAPLATQEGGSLARQVVVADLHDAAPPPRPALRALITVADPSDAAHWGLAPVDVAGEAERALEALGAIPADLLAHGHASSSGRSTLANVRHGLRKPAHLLYLIAHGRATDAGTTLYLEGDDGSAAPITGADLAEAIGALAPESRPLLAVLVACEGADQAAAPLASVGPLLARAGVPAVIAMQSQVSMGAAARFTARLLRELDRDGRIDRALAAARAEMGDEWWAPVLWLRSRDGWLWQEKTGSFSSDTLVNIANVQAESVSIGDVAGRDINHTTINVWVWERFAQEVPAWLNQPLDNTAYQKKSVIQQKHVELEKRVEQIRKIQADLAELEKKIGQDDYAQDDILMKIKRLKSDKESREDLIKRSREELIELEEGFGRELSIQEDRKETNRQTWNRVGWKKAAQAYRHEMRRLYGSMHIFGMSHPVPLANVFTDVYLLDKPSALMRHSIEQLKKRSLLHADPMSISQRHEGGALVAQHKRLFILGQPGAGKTTFLKHLAIQAVQNQLAAIPVFVSLKAWSDCDLDLMPFLIRQFAICDFPNAQSFIEMILDTGQAIVLFDGLDEVSAEGGRHQRITRTIREFAQQYARSQVVITCRTAATEYTFEQFTYCEVADFTQAEIDAFVGRWFQQHDAKREAFLKEFAQPENERLRDLARRPLLLTMLCLSFNETMNFPQRRAELYEEAIDALLKKWDSSRDIQRDIIYRKLSLGHKRQLLAELAAETFERGEFFIPKKQLVSQIVRFLRRLPPPDQHEDIDGEVILRSIEAQHGLLIERASGIYSFSHLTFHEYFAARYIADHPEPQVLRNTSIQATKPQWREVLLLTASMLDYRNSGRLFQSWSQHLVELLQPNPPLVVLIKWVETQSEKLGSANISMRAAVLRFAMLDQAIMANQILISSHDINQASAQAKKLAYAITSMRARELASALDRESDVANDLVKKLRSLRSNNPSNTILLENQTDIESAKFLASGLANSITSDGVRKIASSLASIMTSIQNLISIRSTAISHVYTLSHILIVYSQKTLHDFWEGREVPEWEEPLTGEQLALLGVYLNSTRLLLECLDLASIENRQAVLDRLLVPPVQ